MIPVYEAADEAILPETNDDGNATIASQITLNIKGEYDAIEGYMKLIPWFEEQNDQDAIADIQEIISDEKEHTERLNRILMRYDGNIEPAED